MKQSDHKEAGKLLIIINLSDCHNSMKLENVVQLRPLKNFPSLLKSQPIDCESLPLVQIQIR